MNRKSLYSVEEIIASAYIILDIEDTRDNFIFKEWAWDAVREIGVGRFDIKEACIEVDEDNTFDKPCDFLYPIDLNILDSYNKPYSFDYSQNGFMETENTSSLNGFPYQKIVVSEQRTHFSISSNAKGIVKANLKYYAYPIDEDGNMLIDERSKEAVLAFIQFKYHTRERNKNRNNVPLSEVNYYQNNWINAMRQAKGRKKMPSVLDGESIIRKWLTLIPNYKDKARNSYRRGRIRR